MHFDSTRGSLHFDILQRAFHWLRNVFEYTSFVNMIIIAKVNDILFI